MSATDHGHAPRKRSELPVIVAFVVAILASLGLTVTYTLGGQPQLEGIFLGLALGGIGVGVVAWAQRFMPGEEVAEERPVLASDEEQIAAFTASFEKGGESLGRRGLLVKLGLGAVAPLGLDAFGFLIATGDFSAPVGGGFWDRGRGPDLGPDDPPEGGEEA